MTDFTDSGPGKIFPPVFATNRPDRQQTVAAEVNRLLRVKRETLRVAPDIAIATAYLNPAGVELLLDELEQAPRVRLLLGAEPDPRVAEPRARTLARDELRAALRRHTAWLEAERDLTGFNREAEGSARRMVAWLNAEDDHGAPRVEVRRFTEGFLHGKAFLVDQQNQRAVLAGSSNLTFAGLARNAELNLGYPSGHHTELVQGWFNEFWDRSETFDLARLYASRWDPHEPWTVFLRMLWELYGRDLDRDEEPVPGPESLRLTGFQRDGLGRLLRLLGQNGGVLFADEVGLGKTYVAGAAIREAAAKRRQKVLVVAPAALKQSMWEPFLKEHDFPRRVEVMSYDDLRLRWQQNETEVRRELDEFALVVVDEAHNLRNPNAQRTEAVAALVGGEVPKQVVLLTATPVNNSLGDLHALLSLFIRNDAAFAAAGIPSMRKYIRDAERLDPESLSPEHLFDLLDRVAVRRTRLFVREHYRGDHIPGPDGEDQVVRFPTPALHRLDYELDPGGEGLLEATVQALLVPDDEAEPATSPDACERSADGTLEACDCPGDPGPLDERRLLLARYTPHMYRKAGPEDGEKRRQLGNAGLLRCHLLKCMESSPAALAATLGTLIASHEAFLAALHEGWVLTGEALGEWIASDAEDLAAHLKRLDRRSKAGAAPADRYCAGKLTEAVESDLALLQHLRQLANSAARREAEPKSDCLIDRLRKIAALARTTSRHGLSRADRRKTIVFSNFVATVRDLHRRVSRAVEEAPAEDPFSDYRGRLPAHPIHGSKAGVDQKNRARVLAGFAPTTAGSEHSEDRYDLLFTTDVLSEGVNLQQAGRIVNYDLPWNPMRVVQRHGRIDRIGSPHQRIVLDCFFPARRLDELLDLEATLRRKLRIADATVGTGSVLPGVVAGEGQVFADTRQQIEELRNEDTAILERGGQHRALSGEEYRHQLREALRPGSGHEKLTELPWGSGSGFVRTAGRTSGYVFCIRVGHCPRRAEAGPKPGAQAATPGCRRESCEVCGRSPRFRFVETDDRWQPVRDAAGEPRVSAETLESLIAADPGSEHTERTLSEAAYDGAFTAWEIARADVFAEWTKLTDPANLQPDVPKAFRDATELLHRQGDKVLGLDEVERLVPCFSTVPSARVQREVRALLNADDPPTTTVRRLRDLARKLGLQPPAPVEPLPPITEDDVHLVAWMAVRGSGSRS